MTKRKWLFTTLLAGCISMGYAEEKTSVPLPTPAQITWQEAELTAVFHYDLHVFDGKQYNQAFMTCMYLTGNNIIRLIIGLRRFRI